MAIANQGTFQSTESSANSYASDQSTLSYPYITPQQLAHEAMLSTAAASEALMSDRVEVGRAAVRRAQGAKAQRKYRQKKHDLAQGREQALKETLASLEQRNTEAIAELKRLGTQLKATPSARGILGLFEVAALRIDALLSGTSTSISDSDDSSVCEKVAEL